ncbi:MAG: hypothetical protein ACRCWD_06325 [Culicoidibacterales bacterium]
MKKKLWIILGVFGLFCLGVEMATFYQVGYFVDEFNTSPTVVLGGTGLLVLTWLKLLVLAMIPVIAGIGIYLNSRKNEEG